MHLTAFSSASCISDVHGAPGTPQQTADLAAVVGVRA